MHRMYERRELRTGEIVIIYSIRLKPLEEAAYQQYR